MIRVEEMVCITGPTMAGTAGEVAEDERGLLDEDACADAAVADVMAARSAKAVREALERALGMEGYRGPWCRLCGPVCRCGGAS